MLAPAERRAGAPVLDDAARPFAVVDIGSNSIRLVVYERLCRAPIALFNEKSVCGLGKSLAATGRLGSSEIDAALHALRRFAHIAHALRVGEIEYVATEAVRRAANGSEFLREAERATGRPIDVLSGRDEADAAAMGVAYSFHQPDGVVGDLGGGSVDLARVTPDGPRGPAGSLPLGTLPVAAMLVADPASAARAVDAQLDRLPWLRDAARDRRFYVVGGGWRALARIRQSLTDAPLKVVHAYSLPAEAAVTLGRTVAALGEAELQTVPGMPGRRLGTVRAAGLMFERVVRRLRPDEVVFSASGLREGRVFQRLPAAMLREDPLLAGAGEFGRRRARLSAIGAAMGWWTTLLFPDETPDQRRLRLAVCEVSDTAWREHPAFRAREAFFRLAQYPFIGLTHAERAFIAFAVFIRYEGSPEDAFIRTIMTLLPDADRRRAQLLGAALQIGYRVSAAVPDLLEPTRLEIAGDALHLHLTTPDAEPDPDILKPRLRALTRLLGLKSFKVLTAA